MLEDVAARVFEALGLRGVSTVALVLLVSVVLYAHKAASAGRRVVHVGSTAQHDAKVVAGVLALLLVAGVLSADLERGQELLRLGREHLRRARLLQRLVELVS
ncbi:hypothetical protein [Halobaculum sp. P14]|uniref:hypothetical protein n=1 Tax=Halobaculum sp. P14 TaxID=3421638 RepID=UPI003EBF7073